MVQFYETNESESNYTTLSYPESAIEDYADYEEIPVMPISLSNIHVYHSTQVGLSVLITAVNIVFMFALRYWSDLKLSFKVVLINMGIVNVIFCVAFAIKSFFVLYKFDSILSCVGTTAPAFWCAGASSTLILTLSSDAYWAAKTVEINNSIYDEAWNIKVYGVIFIIWVLWGGLTTGLFVDVDETIVLTCFFPTWYSNRSYVLGCCFFILGQIVLVIFLHIAATQLATVRIYEIKDDTRFCYDESCLELVSQLEIVQKISMIAFVFCIIFIFTWGILVITILIHISLKEISAAVKLFFIVMVNIFAASPLFICLANSSKYRKILKMFFTFERESET